MSIVTEIKKEIQKEADFLIELGYKETEDEYSINYSLNNYSISVCFPPNCEESDVTIRFLDTNQVFSIGWIALVRNKLEANSGKLENVIELIKYAKENYRMVTNYQYCVQSNILIDEYIEQHRNQFAKSVADFLDDL
ncbi:MAG: hypothetical protein RR646_00010 [Erysipelotrichaceae bacterium]